MVNPVLVDEDEDPEEEEPQEEEDDMEVDIEEDENEPELTYLYEEVDPLNPSPPDSESEPKDVIEVENPIEHEDETVPASIHEVGESSTASFIREDSDGLLPGLMRRDINSLFGRMASLSRRPCGRETTHALVEKKGKSKDEYYGNLMLLVESVDAAIAAERAKQANVRNDASGSGPVRGQDAAPAVRECTFAGFMKCNPASFRGDKKVKFATATIEGPALTWWKTKVATMGLETMNQMPWTKMKQLMTAEFCPIEEIQCMEHELWNLKGEVTLSKPANLNEAVCMAHKLMEQKSQDRNERILEGKKRKWESLQGRNSSGKGNQKDNSRQTLQNNQKQGNAERWLPLLLMESFLCVNVVLLVILVSV
ncbi:hypothetical protein Tco_1471821 [Tanacetum coccineum]